MNLRRRIERLGAGRTPPRFRVIYRPADMDDRAFAAKLAAETTDLGPDDVALVVRFVLPAPIVGQDDAATVAAPEARH